MGRAQQRSILQQANVAVTASHAHCQHLGAGPMGGRKILSPEEGEDFRGESWIGAPGFELWPRRARRHRQSTFSSNTVTILAGNLRLAGFRTWFKKTPKLNSS